MRQAEILSADSVTKLPAGARGAVVVAASHGGIFAAHVGAEAGVLAIILNDAGIGLDQAGVSGLAYLDGLGIPAAAIDYRSARIGDGADMIARGVISVVNCPGAKAGVSPGQSVRDAAALLAGVPLSERHLKPLPGETRVRLDLDGAMRPVWLMDSASLVTPSDNGAIVITASHGGLLGGRPETAIKAPVFAAIYNDAGFGADNAGVSRLPVLDRSGIAGATVAAQSARIGDARSSYENGILSCVNETATAFGGRVGMRASDFVAHLSKQGR